MNILLGKHDNSPLSAGDNSTVCNMLSDYFKEKIDIICQNLDLERSPPVNHKSVHDLSLFSDFSTVIESPTLEIINK